MDTPAGESRIESAPAASTTEAGQSQSQPDLSNANLDEIERLFAGEDVEFPAVASSEEGGTSEAEKTVVEAEKTEEKPVAEAEKPVEGEEVEKPVLETEKAEEAEFVQRPRLKDPKDQAIAAVKRAADLAGDPISWAEAEKRVVGEKAAPVVVEAGPTLSETVATLEGELADIRAQKKAIVDDGGVLSPEYDDLVEKLSDKQADLKLAQRDLAQAAKAQEAAAQKSAQKSAQLRGEARARAIKAFPAVADTTTPLGKAVQERITALKDPSHADHALLFSDSAPWTIALDVANELGIAPVKPADASSSTAPAKVMPPKVVTPVVPVASGGKPTETLKPEETKGTVEYLKSPNRTLEELDEASGFNEGITALLATAR